MIETDLRGACIGYIEGIPWGKGEIGASVFKHGTLASVTEAKKAYAKLRAGTSPVLCGFSTIDGHSCRAVLHRTGDKITIRSEDLTPDASRSREDREEARVRVTPPGKEDMTKI